MQKVIDLTSDVNQSVTIIIYHAHFENRLNDFLVKLFLNLL